MMQRQRKYVAEYVNGAPTCGTMLDIDNTDLEPLQGQLISLALHKRLENANNGGSSSTACIKSAACCKSAACSLACECAERPGKTCNVLWSHCLWKDAWGELKGGFAFHFVDLMLASLSLERFCGLHKCCSMLDFESQILLARRSQHPSNLCPAAHRSCL